MKPSFTVNAKWALLSVFYILSNLLTAQVENCKEQCSEGVSVEEVSVCERCVENLLEEGDTANAAEALRILGKSLFYEGSLDSALTYLDLSAKLYTEVGNGWKEASVRSSMAQVLVTNGQYETALKQMEWAIHAVEVPAYKDSIHPYYSHLGELMYTLGEYEQAIVYNKRGMELYQRFNQNFFYQATAYSLATAYMDLEEYELADSAIKVAKTVKPEEHYALQALIMQKRTEARYYYLIDREDLSVLAYKAIQPIADTMGDFGLFVEVYIGLANDYMYLDQLEEADAMFQRVLKESRLEENVYFLEDVLDSYAGFLSETEQYEAATQVLYQINQHKDSLLAYDRMRDIRELHLVDLEEANFDLTDDNEAKGELIEYYEEYQDLLRSLIVMGSLFILILGVFAFYLWRTAKRLTESRRMLESQNEKLAEVDAQRLQLMKIVGHDLRGPIWSIRNFVELLNQGKIAEGDLPKVQRYALQSVMETQYLLDELTDWAQASGGKYVSEAEEVDLRASTDIILGAYQLHASTKQVELKNEIPEELTVFTDQRALSTIIRNLLENSIKHTQKGSVTLSAKARESGAVITIADTGDGIPPEILESVKRGLGVAGSTGTEGELGKGIGMQSVRLLCEQIGAELEIKSELGVGTEVRVEVRDGR